MLTSVSSICDLSICPQTQGLYIISFSFNVTFLKTCFTPETSTKDIFTESNTRLELAIRLPGFGVAHNKHT